MPAGKDKRKDDGQKEIGKYEKPVLKKFKQLRRIAFGGY